MTTQTEALKHEINLVLTDPDTNLSHGARRALDYVLGQLGALAQPAQRKPQHGIEFLMRADKMAFKIGVQQFTLDYEPVEPGEFEFMRDALLNALSTFTHDVKTSQPAQCAPAEDGVCESLDCPNHKPAQQEPVPEHLDVRRIMLAIVPGDGSGYEVYAKSVKDVEETLSKMDERIEELEYLVKATPQAQPAREPLTEGEVWRSEQLMNVNADIGLLMEDLMRIIRAIEAAHGIKENT